MRKIAWLELAACVALSACATVVNTGQLAPRPPDAPVSAKLGIQVDGDALQGIFSEKERAKVGAATGQYFKVVALLPAEARYSAPQDLYEQYGTDLVLRLQLADMSTNGGMNAFYLPAGALLAQFCAFAPIYTMKMDLVLEASLREARTGRLLWAKTLKPHTAMRVSMAHPAAGMAELEGRSLRNAVIGVFEELKSRLRDYRPGSAETMASAPAPVESPASRRGADAPTALSSKVAPVSPNKYAVVIGIERYREQIPKAEFAADDARRMAQFLTQQGGYKEENVVLRVNEQATKSDLEKYFEPWLKNNTDAKSSLLVYFSGHGTPQTSSGEAYLVPYDGDPAYIEQTGYPLKRLYASLEQLPAKDVVVVLDSCFSGAGGRSVLAKGAKPLVTRVQDSLDQVGKVNVLTATSGNHISMAYEDKGHGLFTYYLLQGLAGEADANGDGVVDVHELYEFLKPQVQRVARKVYNTEQVPQLFVPPGLQEKPAVALVGYGHE